MKTCVGCWAGTSAVQPRRISGDQPRDTTVAKDRCGVRGRQGSSADLPPPPPPCVVPQRVGSDLQNHRGVASQSEVIIAILFEGSPCCEGLIQSGLCSVAGQGTPSCVCCVRGCGQACIVWWGQRRQAIACAGERDAGRRGVDRQANARGGPAWCRRGGGPSGRTRWPARPLAVGETSVILLHPPLPVVRVSVGMERGFQQNDSLADG